MPRSEFDPESPDVIEERGQFLGAPAEGISHMPPSAVDGKVGDDPDVKVPLEGDEPVQPLSTADTDALTQAATEALHSPPPDAPA